MTDVEKRSEPVYGPLSGKELLSDKAYRVIRGAIISGQQPPGSRIVEMDLAKAMHVSQAPIREALKRLAHEGLVTSYPHRGSFVAELVPGEHESARQVRAATERAAAELLARLPAAKRSFPQLHQIVREMEAAAAKADVGACREADISFHRTVTSTASSPLLVRVWSVLEPSLLSQRAIGNPDYPGSWAGLVEEHKELLRLLEEATPEQAGQAFFDHASGTLVTSI